MNPRDRRPGDRRSLDAARPGGAVWYVLGFLLLLALAQAWFTRAGRAADLRTASSRARSAPARSRRSRSATDRIRGTLKRDANGKRHAVQHDAHRGPEARRGSRAAQRQVHRRGGQPLAAASCSAGSIPLLFLVARLELLLPPHGRRRRRRDVVRAQPRQDLRRRRREGAASRTWRAWTRPRTSCKEIVEFLKTPKKYTSSAAASRKACCWSARRAPARRCWRAPSRAKPRSRSSA